HDRGLAVRLAKPADEVEELVQRHSGLQRAQIGRLVDRAISHGVGERDAELDDVRAGAWQPGENVERRFHVGIAARDEGHEGGAVLLFEFGETGGDAAHIFSPSAAATEKTSLSPRPERQTAISLSFSICGATRTM